ncbi:MAG: MBOAT family protein [Dorea sp.]|nr:MBOAT family protein [Dorea sp.]
MVFSSLVFLCVFLPVLYIMYCIIPSLRIRNILLIIASLMFYAYGEPVYVLLLIGSSIVNYAGARWIDTCEKKEQFKQKKLVLTMVVVINLLLLGVFKYTGFVVTSLNSIPGLSLPVPQIALPIGISFFTFQILSYVVDVYQKKINVQKNYFKVLLYISFFPQLIAGPIVKYRDIELEIDDRNLDAREAWAGFRRFLCGLSKKVLIANAMGNVADHIFNGSMDHVNIAVAWIAAISYMLQIYYDFSGYSDMAIGLGRMFGFHFNENFMYPYGATTIKEFWRRWHISLSTWFREYVYIPLGGNRKGKARTSINKMIVFLCTGLWHGANWTFVIWGIYHGFFLLLEDYVPAIKKLPKFLGHIYAVIVVCVGFVIFRAETIGQAAFVIKQMFTGFTFDAASKSLAMQQLTPYFIVMFVVALIGMAPIAPLTRKVKSLIDPALSMSVAGEKGKKAFVACVVNVLAFVLLFWCMIRLSGSTYNPFIYFRF